METAAMLFPLILLTAMMAVIVFILSRKKPVNYTGQTASTLENIIFTLIGFFMPVLGIILYLVLRKSRPELAAPILTGIKAYLWIIITALIIMFLFSIITEI